MTSGYDADIVSAFDVVGKITMRDHKKSPSQDLATRYS